MKPCDTCLAIGSSSCDGCTVKQTHIQNASLRAALSMCAEKFEEIEKYAKEQAERDLEILGDRVYPARMYPEVINQDIARLNDEASGIARQAHDMAEFCEKLTKGE